MIDRIVLRDLVLEVLRRSEKTNFTAILHAVQELADERDVFPSQEQCQDAGIEYRRYEKRQLNPIDKMNVNEIIWDLIVERILTWGYNEPNPNWPFLRLTEFGKVVISQPDPQYHDPHGYVEHLMTSAPNLDPVIEQYVIEGLKSFKQQLIFASAVMFGAAAEKAILLLLEAIKQALVDPVKKKHAQQLLDRSRLPDIFEFVEKTITVLINSKTIPYSVHQGSTEHLLSLFEMVRVQRNDAVHPAAGQVSRAKVFLTLQTLPAALECVYRLIDWFSLNQIP